MDIIRNIDPPKTRAGRHNDVPLSAAALDIIEGELLGDGFIVAPVSQGHFKLRTTDQEYANWLLDCLQKEGVPIVPSGYAKPGKQISKNGSVQTVFTVCTQTTMQFGELHRKWYDGKRKRVPNDLEINPTRLLHWWIGDGSVRSNGCSAIFCTDCFNLEEHQVLVEKFSNIGLCSTIAKENSYFRLFLPLQACKLIEMIGSCPFNSMTHKWNVRQPGRIMSAVSISPAELKSLYVDQNIPASKIAAMFGCSRCAIYEKARSIGIKKTPNKRPKKTVWSTELVNSVLDMASENLCMGEIASKTGIGRKQVRHILEDAGLLDPNRPMFWGKRGI